MSLGVLLTCCLFFCQIWGCVAYKSVAYKKKIVFIYWNEKKKVLIKKSLCLFSYKKNLISSYKNKDVWNVSKLLPCSFGTFEKQIEKKSSKVEIFTKVKLIFAYNKRAFFWTFLRNRLTNRQTDSQTESSSYRAA